MPQHECRGQRITCGSLFSSSDIEVLGVQFRSCGKVPLSGSHLAHAIALPFTIEQYLISRDCLFLVAYLPKSTQYNGLFSCEKGIRTGSLN